MINLDEESLTKLQQLLHQHIPEYNVWLFGSRATKNCKPYSDIDLVIITKDPLPDLKIAELNSFMTESDIPYKIDLLDWSTLTPSFQKIILKNYEIIQTSFSININ
jgi:uncharacterized protein